MDQYIVTGMSCAACQARVEKAVSAVPGVESVSVSLLSNSMGVTGSASPAEIVLWMIRPSLSVCIVPCKESMTSPWPSDAPCSSFLK